MGFYSKLYTDYPFYELGDEDGKEAPLREIEVLNYDGDKYCQIKVEGIETSIKAGYIYTSSEFKLDYCDILDKKVKKFKNFDPNRHLMTNKEYAEYRKSKRKRKVIYKVCSGKEMLVNVKEFKKLDKALKYFRRLTQYYFDVNISKYISHKGGFTWIGSILNLEDDEYVQSVSSKGRCYINNFHLDKYNLVYER